jgi:hypothetical protein
VNQSTLYKSWRTSETVRFGTIWDNHTISQTWHVERVDGNALKPNDISGILFETGSGAPVIPGIDDPYYFPTGGLGTSWMESALVRSVTFRGMEGKGLGVQVEYATRYFEANAAKGMASNVEDFASATTLAKGLFLPCQVLPIFTSRSMQRYRDNPGMTSPSASLDVSSGDIGGALKEIDEDVRQVGLKLRFINDANSLSMLGTPSVDGLVDVAEACIGYKNSAAFLGRPIGALYCSGATVNHLEAEFHEFVLEFLFDQYFHHSQIVKKASDGRPQMNNDNYAEVKWARTARGGVDFNDIWPSGDLGKSLKYQAFAGRWY